MRTPRKITGVTVKTVLDDRKVEVVFRSPYRWRIYEGEHDVTKQFGFPLRGHCIEDSAELSAFHAKVDAGEISQRIHAQF